MASTLRRQRDRFNLPINLVSRHEFPPDTIISVFRQNFVLLIHHYNFKKNKLPKIFKGSGITKIPSSHSVLDTESSLFVFRTPAFAEMKPRTTNQVSGLEQHWNHGRISQNGKTYYYIENRYTVVSGWGRA
jgi:hypothetical protein